MTTELTQAAIARHTAANPGGIAVINNGISISYGDLGRAVASFSEALVALGLRPGQVAAIECGVQYLHLLLVLACERLGVVSASFAASELEQSLPLLAQVDLTITEQPARAAGARRVHAITKSWVDATLSSSPGPMTPVPEARSDPWRIQRTSGTTGTQKRVLLGRGVRDGRIASWARIDEFAPGHRVLIALRFTFGSAYWQAAMALRAGAIIVFENRITLTEALALHRIDRVTLMPLQLREMLERMPPTFTRPPALAITTMGGRVSPAVRRRALELAAVRLREVYSCNEAGNIAMVERDDDAAIGTLCPGAQVDIVDERDVVLPYGQVGRIRVRTPYMADGFIDDPEATARMFRNGWFYPGDVGILHAPDRLEVIGRDDEILNIGGLKTVPGVIEDTLRARSKVDDVGACVLPNADGVDELWVALVYDASDDRDIRERIMPALRDFPYGHIRLIKLDRIPRTESGKIKRAELREAVASERRSSAARG